MNTDSMWGVVIGKKGTWRYVAYRNDGELPSVYFTRKEARARRKQILANCGHKQVHAVQLLVKGE
ncbi:MAG: hypothetical protein GF334_04320 [Candidatus Altiarchaeales archaeon]|nr:hypothetical protein [Candidatus Altiarchaeales archaeon]